MAFSFPLLRLYDAYMLSLILPALMAFVCTVVFHAIALQLFPCMGLLDFPQRYGLLRARIPYPTGVIAVVVFLGFFLALLPWTMHNLGVAIGVTLLACISFIDDRHPLPALLRLATQIIVSMVVFVCGSRIYTFTSPLPWLTGSSIIPLDSLRIIVPVVGPLPVLSGIFTIVWLGLTINALNWFDGIPGQVSVIATLGFLTISLLSLSPHVGQPDVALIALVLAGVSGGCMLFDLPPPRVLMGDTGAMFFGLMLGILTIYAGGKVATAFLVLGVPLLDFFFVALHRLSHGRSPLAGSAQGEHLHHRLLQRGWKPEHIIVLTACIGMTFGVVALFLNTSGKFIALLMLGTIMSVLWRYASKSAV